MPHLQVTEAYTGDHPLPELAVRPSCVEAQVIVHRGQQLATSSLQQGQQQVETVLRARGTNTHLTTGTQHTIRTCQPIHRPVCQSVYQAASDTAPLMTASGKVPQHAASVLLLCKTC
jgi:hypothetical protein